MVNKRNSRSWVRAVIVRATMAEAMRQMPAGAAETPSSG
jgi:hypothetical protein